MQFLDKYYYYSLPLEQQILVWYRKKSIFTVDNILLIQGRSWSVDPINNLFVVPYVGAFRIRGIIGRQHRKPGWSNSAYKQNLMFR